MDRWVHSFKAKTIKLVPVRPNAGVAAAYRKRLDAMANAMVKSVIWHLSEVYKVNPPEMAQDSSPAVELRNVVNRMRRYWEKRFDELALPEARKFVSATRSHVDRAFSASLQKAKLREAGFTVKFKMTKNVNDIVQASLAEQVSLIKSIPEQFFTQVQSMVSTSVQTGRDMHSLAKDLEKQLGVTKRRAANIARDQNSKATATITRARQTEVGITHAQWLHSAGGRTPRPTHVANNMKTYLISEGWLDPAVGKRIWPGTEINCRCVAISVIPGIT